MHILWVKIGGLEPLDTGGKIRSAHLYRGLAKHHQLTHFTSFECPPEGDPHDAMRASGFYHDVVSVPLQAHTKGTLQDKLGFLCYLLTSPYGYSQYRYLQKHVRAVLDGLVRKNQYDLILCDFSQPAPFLPWDVPVPKVIFTHNVEGLIWKRQAEVAQGFVNRFACQREYLRQQAVERRFLPKADHVLAVSEVDKATFAKYMPPEQITVIPTGVDVDFFQPSGSAPEPLDIVFTGSMDWPPNEAGMLWFVEKILPLIHREIPEARVWVVGRRPTQAIQALGEQHEKVEITGTVDDIRPYLHRGSVYIVPLLSGSGTRIKIFEAMAAGKAVVSTQIGAEGLDVTDGEDIILADEPQAFAEAVIHLMRNEAARKRLEQAARKLVVERFAWPRVVDFFTGVLEGVVERANK